MSTYIVLDDDSDDATRPNPGRDLIRSGQALAPAKFTTPWRTGGKNSPALMLSDAYLQLFLGVLSRMPGELPDKWDEPRQSFTERAESIGKFFYNMVFSDSQYGRKIVVDPDPMNIKENGSLNFSWFRKTAERAALECPTQPSDRFPYKNIGPKMRKLHSALVYEEVCVFDPTCPSTIMDISVEHLKEFSWNLLDSVVQEVCATVAAERLTGSRAGAGEINCRPLFMFLMHGNHTSIISTVDGTNWYHADSIQGYHAKHAEAFVRKLELVVRIRSTPEQAATLSNWHPVCHSVSELVADMGGVSSEPCERKTIFYQMDGISCTIYAFLYLDYFMWTLGNKYPFFSEATEFQMRRANGRDYLSWEEGIVTIPFFDMTVARVREFCWQADYALQLYAPSKEQQADSRHGARVPAATTNREVRVIRGYIPTGHAMYDFDPNASGFF